MLTPRFECAATSLNGLLYVIGGATIANGVGMGCLPLNVVETFDIATCTWSEHSILKTARYGCAAMSVCGKVYVIGGSYRGRGVHEALNSVECFDDEAGMWRYTEPMPARRSRCGAASCLEKIYVFGGVDNGQNDLDILAVDVFDTVSQKWQGSVTNTPGPHSHCCAIAVPT